MAGILRILLICLFTAPISSNCFATSKVALTFDDLPGSYEILDRLSGYLKKNHIPAAGFVIGKKVGEIDRGLDAISAWAERGLPLYNHSWSHEEYSKHDSDWFIEDVKKTENKILEPLRAKFGPWKKIFRFPTLDYGKTEAKDTAFANYLKQSDTWLGHVSIDTSDWIFAKEYNTAFSRNIGPERLNALKILYLAHLAECITYSERSSQTLFSHQISLILLIHASRLNQESIAGIIGLFKNRGYEFISIEDALSDKAYTPFLQKAVSPTGDNFFFQLSGKKGNPIKPEEDPTSYAYYKAKWAPKVKKILNGE